MKKKNPVLLRLQEQSQKYIPHFLANYSDRIICNEASLFVGSGVSKNSGLPSWGTLLAPYAEELGIKIANNTDLYAVAQYYSNQHGDSLLRKRISKEINCNPDTNALLDLLVQIPFNSIWTTNYDKLIERSLENRFAGYNVIVNDKDLASISKDTKISVYKVNGDISEPTGMVVTKNDYEHYTKTHPLFLTFLRKELVANTFVFVGYSFSDSLVLDCLSSLNEYLGDKGNCHYALMYVDNNVDIMTEYFFADLKKRYNICCIALTKDEYPRLIEKLIIKTRERKVFISGSFDSISEEENRFADKLSYELVHCLYENNYRIATGIGKRLGTFITGYAHQYLAEQRISNPTRFLSMRPFPFHLTLSENEKIRYRQIMQADCSAIIIMFGQSKTTETEGGVVNTGHYSRGVYMEYTLAKESGLAIIPVGSTGYEAELIWSEIKANINRYYYLSKKIDVLRNEKDPHKLSEIIVSILNDVSKNRRIN